MRAGLIVEGLGDHAVVSNILKGMLDLDQCDIEYLRPALAVDETDKHNLKPDHFGNYAMVIEECKKQTKINAFLNIEGNELLVVHLDLAEYHSYEITVPPNLSSQDRTAACRIIHDLLVKQIDIWTQGKYKDYLCHALAAQETEAWILTIHEPQCAETSTFLDPKRRFRDVVGKRALSKTARSELGGLREFERSNRLSQAFKRRKDLLKCAERNFSLKFLCEQLEKHAPTLSD